MDPRRLNESLQELLCRPGNGTGSANGTGTGPTWNGSACDLLRRGLRGPQAPKELDLTVRVLLYALIFVLSVCGNALVVAVLLLNRRLRTVTNSFLLSLALSDLMLALCCMPFTLIPNLMGTFVFGEAVCKLMAYLMGVSVSVSTFSLVAIAIERYSAICNPLQSRVWQTRSHACRVIASTWLFSALLMLPYAVYSTTRLLPVPGARPPLSQCTHAWPSEHVRQAWYVLLLLVLFFIPGVVMIVAYGLISRELYRGIRFELDIKGEAAVVCPVPFPVPFPVPCPAPPESSWCQIHDHATPACSPAQHRTVAHLRRGGRLLPAALTAGRCAGAAGAGHGGGTTGAGAHQQLRGKAGGQAARHPHAGGHRGHVLPLLAAHLCGQHVACLRTAGSPARALGDAHLLHPPAVLHLRLRQPAHLLLHEPPLPQRLPGHLCRLPPCLPAPRARRGRGQRQRIALQVQLHHCQQPRPPLSPPAPSPPPDGSSLAPCHGPVVVPRIPASCAPRAPRAAPHTPVPAGSLLRCSCVGGRGDAGRAPEA
uniref:Gastrin/cholecystokinin type B receptor n=1 Tax=Gallus gallus TaxID=9031 RepID=A0A8V0X2V2_CHICK